VWRIHLRECEKPLEVTVVVDDRIEAPTLLYFQVFEKFALTDLSELAILPLYHPVYWQ
jgi:hypothetical protein